jgi:hypothetical protein
MTEVVAVGGSGEEAGKNGGPRSPLSRVFRWRAQRRREHLLLRVGGGGAGSAGSRA